MIQFLTIWVFSLTIFQVFLAIKAQTCSTGCTPMVNAGTSSTVLNPGQLCLLTGTTNGCSYTNATCTGFSTSVQTSLAAQLKSTLQATPIGSPVPGAGPSTGNFECGSDGNWYLTGFIITTAALTTNLFCDIGCNPSPCPAASACSTTTTSTSTTTSSGCSACGTWGAWTTPTACTDTCGSCGTTTKTRTCLSASSGCPCIGSTSRTTYCNLTPCNYPRSTCCNNMVSTLVNTNFSCGPQPPAAYDVPCGVPTPAPACPYGGIWSAWSTGTCNATCGMCGTLTRTRTCLSYSTNGCGCSGSTTDTSLRCPNTLCSFPNPSCCSGATRTTGGTAFICSVSG